MGKVIKYSFFILLLTLYIYSVKFTFLPVTGKVIIAGLGLITIIIDLLSGKTIPRINSIVIPTLYLTIWGIIVVFVNSTDQFLYVNYLVSIASAFFASYFIVRVSYRNIASFELFLLFIAAI